MILFKITYKRQNDNTEYDANILGSSPESIREYLESKYGYLSYFRTIGRTEIHLVMPDIEKNIYTRLNKEKENEQN